jgi:hypothetical protein
MVTNVSASTAFARGVQTQCAGLHDMHASSNFRIERLQQGEYSKWFGEFSDWTHAVTVTPTPTRKGFPRAKRPTLSATAHFVSVLNRRVLGNAMARKGSRIAFVAVYGEGPYGDSPTCIWPSKRRLTCLTKICIKPLSTRSNARTALAIRTISNATRQRAGSLTCLTTAQKVCWSS